MTRGHFVVFEGIDGSGKSTQARLLADRLGAVLTREPGGTPLGAELRRLLLGAGPEVGPRAEALLMAADRAQHVLEVVEPALAAGRWVVSDRFTGSSIAYQGAGRGLGPKEVAALSDFAAPDCRPDLVVLLDLDPTTATGRLEGPEDRIEAEGAEMQRSVRRAYLGLAADEPSRWRVVPADGEEADVAGRVLEAVASVGLGVPSEVDR